MSIIFKVFIIYLLFKLICVTGADDDDVTQNGYDFDENTSENNGSGDSTRLVRWSFQKFKNFNSLRIPTLKPWFELTPIRSEWNRARENHHQYAVPGVKQSDQQTAAPPLFGKLFSNWQTLSTKSPVSHQNGANRFFSVPVHSRPITATTPSSGKESVENKTDKPLIVQPKSTLDTKENSKPVDIKDGKIFATQEQIKETAEIRKEINAAVKHNEFAVSSAMDAGEGSKSTIKPDSTSTTPSSASKPLIVQPETTLDTKDDPSRLIKQNGAVIATPEQIKETADIREEIKEAVENHEFAVPSAVHATTDSAPSLNPGKTLLNKPSKPLVVQPDSTLDTKDSSQPIQDKKVSIFATPEQIKETAEIREEINDSVQHNEFAVPPVTKPTAFPESFQVLNQLVGEKNKQSTKNNETDQIISIPRSDFSFVAENEDSPSPAAPSVQPNPPPVVSPSTETESKIEDMTKKLLEDARTQSVPKIIPNFVDSKTTGSSNSLPISSNRLPRGSREVLTINSVHENPNFLIGDQVFAWKTLQRNTKVKHALIGLMPRQVVLVHEQNGEYRIKKEVPLFSNSTCLTTFTRWNSVNNTIEGVVIVGSQRELVFLLVNEAMDDMEVFWLWQISKPLTAIEHFQIEHMNLLVLVSNNANRNTADLYRFNANTKDFWLLQGIVLKTPANNFAYFHTGYDHLLSFPQNSSAVVYRFSKGRFIYHTELATENSKIVSAFEMGGYAYLALGGDKPVVMRYQNGNFYPQTFLAKGWGTVEFFLPVSARTYRDDLILLVQHRIEFDSHKISVVEALIWNGEAFDAALAIPCHINNDTMNRGLECMIDLEREAGIQGATVIQHSRYITIVVPRHEAPSGLFDFRVELKKTPIDPPDNDASLYTLFAEVMKYLKIHENLYRNGSEVLAVSTKNEPLLLENINTVNTESLAIDDKVKVETILLGEEVLTTENLVKINEFKKVLNETLEIHEKLDKLEEKSRQVRQTEPLHIEKLHVTNLNVGYFNEVPAENLVFVENGSLVLRHPLVIEKELKVNQVEILADQLVGVEETMVNKAVPDLKIAGDLKFDVINGIPWIELTNEIVLKDLPNFLKDLEITGELTVEDSVAVNQLADLPFPDGYLWSSSNDASVITGRKEFINLLTTHVLDCSGTLNDVDPFDLITLSGSQNIPGTTTFRQLEVTESLDVHGDISGRHLDDFLANPNLLQANDISSNCHFQSIFVNGTIFIQGKLNERNVDEILSGVVYKHEETPVCSSLKTFASITGDILLTSKLVNDIPLTDYMTKDTDQTIDIDQLYGNVYFNKLHINGHFNSINITELDDRAIKLSGEQYTEVELVFEKGMPVDIKMNELEIRKTVNRVHVDQFISIDEDFELKDDIKLKALAAEDCTVNGEIKSSTRDGGSVNGWILKDLENAYLSKNTEQNINAPYFVNTVIVRGIFNAEYINNFHFPTILDSLKNFKGADELYQPYVSVDLVVVNGSVTLDEVNGYDFDKIRDNAIWLNRPNKIEGTLEFLDEVVVNGKLSALSLNKENFDAFANDLVLRSNENVTIGGTTIFKGKIFVKEDVNANYLNLYPIESILTKNYSNEIRNPINIYGDVTTTNIDLKGSLNGVPFGYYEGAYGFNEDAQSHVLTADVYFQKPVKIERLQLEGSANNVLSVKLFLANVVRKNMPFNLTAPKVFVKPVTFESNLHIIKNDQADLESFFANIVLIDQADPIEFFSPVTFINEVKTSIVNVKGNLVTPSIFGCSVDEWLLNGIRIDLPFDYPGRIRFKEGGLDASNINAVWWNKHFLAHAVTLYTPQNFTGHVAFGDVYSHSSIDVNGTVDGLILPDERENTLMVNGDNQYVQGPIIFESIRVLKSLTAVEPINGKYLQLAVPIQHDITLEPPIIFSDVVADRLYTDYQINGINFTEWANQSLRKYGLPTQIVSGHWKLKAGFFNNITTPGNINGIEVNAFAEQLNDINRELNKKFQHTCDEVHGLVHKSKKNVLFISHFENAFTIPHENKIHSMYFFTVGFDNFLLLNSGCWSFLYIWNGKSKIYEKLSDVYTGIVNEWIHVFDEHNALHFVSSSNERTKTCEITGTNVWLYKPADQAISHALNIVEWNELKMLHTKPHSRSRFYALHISGQVVEYDLGGHTMQKWKLSRSKSEDDSHEDRNRFVPRKANLGFALTDGETLSVLSTKTETVKSINDHSNIADVLVRLPDGKGKVIVDALDVIHDLIQENKRKKDYESDEGDDYEAARSRESNTSSAQNITRDPILTSSDAKGKLIVDVLDFVHDLIEKNKENHENNGESDDDYDVNMHRSVSNATNQSATNTTHDPVLKSPDKTGKLIVDVLDFVHDLIEKNKQSHESDEEAYDNYADDVKLSRSKTQQLKLVHNSSLPLNQSNPQVGSFVGDMENIMVDGINTVSHLLTGEDSTDDDDDEDDNGLSDLLGKPRPNTTVERTMNGESKIGSTKDPEVGDLFSDVQHRISHDLAEKKAKANRYNSAESRHTVDHLVTSENRKTQNDVVSRRSKRADLFGELVDKITPLADKITDAVVDELADRKGEDYDYDVGKPRSGNKTAKSNIPGMIDSANPKARADLFGELVDKLTPLADDITDKVADELADRKEESSSDDDEYDVGKTLSGNKTAKFGNLTKSDTVNPQVRADLFGEIVDKLTPLADDITDKVADELADRKEENDDYSDEDLGRVKNITLASTSTAKNPVNSTEEVGGVISKIGEALKAVLDVGKSAITEIQSVDDNTPLYRNAQHRGHHNAGLLGSSDPSISEANETDPTSGPIIGKEIENNVHKMENKYMPAAGSGDIVVVTVGSHKQTLTIITSMKENVIKGEHDHIFIYEDIVEGKLFQTIPCYKPRSLISLQSGKETLIAFVEGESLIRTFIYRGVEGFVEFTSFPLPTHISSMTTNSISSTLDPLVCPENYLVVSLEKEVWFLKAVTIGHCKIDADIPC